MTGPLGRRIYCVMWRSVRSPAGDGVPLDAWLNLSDEGHGETRQLVADAVAVRRLLTLCRGRPSSRGVMTGQPGVDPTTLL